MVFVEIGAGFAILVLTFLKQLQQMEEKLMSDWTLYVPYAVAFWLFVVGCFGITQSRNLIHTILCVAVVQSSTYVLLLSAGFHAKAGAPIFWPQIRREAPLSTLSCMR